MKEIKKSSQISTSIVKNSKGLLISKNMRGIQYKGKTLKLKDLLINKLITTIERVDKIINKLFEK